MIWDIMGNDGRQWNSREKPCIELVPDALIPPQPAIRD
jgi:hypothetical protein